MRWNDLFADLEGQLAAATTAQFNAEVSELTRAERAQVDLASRVVGSKGTEVTVTVGPESRITGLISDAAAQWILMTAGVRQYVIPMSAVRGVSGLGATSVPVSDIDRKLSLGHVLRALSRDRARVLVQTDAFETSGLIAAVGADFLEVATSIGDKQRSTVPFSAVCAIRSADG